MADNNCMQGFIHAEDETEEIKSLKHNIAKMKNTHSGLLLQIDDLVKDTQTSEALIDKVHSRADKLQNQIFENKQALLQEEKTFQDKFANMKEEGLELNEKIKDTMEEIDRCKKTTENLRKVCLSGMERKMVFKGKIANGSGGLSVKHQILYPVRGGSALITFTEESVAANLISDRDHKVNIEDFCIPVKVEPVELSVLDALCMEMNLSSSNILVYNLPPNLPEQTLLDKLELYFGKCKNGGGEVDKIEFLPDCRSVIITFVDGSVVSGLVKRKTFQVSFGETSHSVSVAPSLDGKLKQYKMKNLKCNRTVLLTGIPDLTDKDNMQDMLELHLQKKSRDGVQALMYCPAGENTVALFEDDQDDLLVAE